MEQVFQKGKQDDKTLTKLIKRKIKCKRRYITIDMAPRESVRDISKYLKLENLKEMDKFQGSCELPILKQENVNK